MLNTFEPITFPKAISVEPENAALTETINSGAEVANATTVSPMIIGDILKFLAILVLPSTRMLLDFASTIKPIINIIRLIKNINLL